MMDEEELRRELAKYCSSASWHVIGQDGRFQILRCMACGYEVRDDVTTSRSWMNMPHKKLEHQHDLSTTHP